MKPLRRIQERICPHTGGVVLHKVHGPNGRAGTNKPTKARAPTKAEKAERRRAQPRVLRHPASLAPAATARPAHDDPAWLLITADVLAVGYCQECGSTRQLTVDHIVPLGLGGGNHRANLQCLCRRCNKNKGSRLPADDMVYTMRVAA